MTLIRFKRDLDDLIAKSEGDLTGEEIRNALRERANEVEDSELEVEDEEEEDEEEDEEESENEEPTEK